MILPLFLPEKVRGILRKRHSVPKSNFSDFKNHKIFFCFFVLHKSTVQLKYIITVRLPPASYKSYRNFDAVLVFRVVGYSGHGRHGRIGAGVGRGRRLDGYRTGSDNFEFGHRGRLLRLGLLLLFGPVKHALGAGGLEVEPAQCTGRACDEIVSGRCGTVTGSRRRCWRSRRRLPHENRHPVLLLARAAAADADPVSAGPAGDLYPENEQQQ